LIRNESVRPAPGAARQKVHAERPLTFTSI
jgi:hypothetical protein